MLKYVISEDIDVLLRTWCEKQNFCLPNSYFFRELRQEMSGYLESIFGRNSVDMIPASYLTAGIMDIVQKIKLFPISMDRVYFPTNIALEVNRTVDLDLNDNGLTSRFGFEPIQLQIKKIVDNCPPEIALVDDVVFSGNGISEIIDLLSKQGVKVRSVVAGIAVGNGFQHLRVRKIEIYSVKFYPAVVDEICERDFYPGVPMSGRLVTGTNINTGASYLLPFGKPEEWASIPKHEIKEFSSFCIQQSIKLWQKIENTSHKAVLTKDLLRVPYGMQDKSIRIIDALYSILNINRSNKMVDVKELTKQLVLIPSYNEVSDIC